MDARKKILSLLAEGSAEATQIAGKTELRGTRLAWLLRDLEKKKLIVWEEDMWRLVDSSEPDRR